MGLFDKAKAALRGHPDKVDTGVDKAGDMADDKAGDKYTKHVDTAQDAAKDRLTGDAASTHEDPIN